MPGKMIFCIMAIAAERTFCRLDWKGWQSFRLSEGGRAVINLSLQGLLSLIGRDFAHPDLIEEPKQQ